MGAVLVENADRMMTSAELLKEGIEFTFVDGRRGLVPFAEIPEVNDGGNLASVELPNPYEAILHASSGETVELPWDFVRHYCDASYRPRVEAVGLAGTQAIGARIRQLRLSIGLTQEALAQAANIGRVTLVRIENGDQSPRYETLVSLAQALGRPVQDLVTEDAAMTTTWAGAEGYDQLMGRWSSRLAPLLIEFADVKDGDQVLDMGCGTGSLTRALLEHLPQSEVVGLDPASPYIEYAGQRLTSPRVRFEVGNAQDLPFPDAAFDACLSLLVLNFVPDARRAVTEMSRVTTPGGKMAAAVWDYGEGMEMLRILWDTAVTLDPSTGSRHERNMPYCRKGELAALCGEAGLQQVEETALTIPLEFSSFEDYWTPFLSGLGPSGSYVSGLPAENQQALRDQLQRSLLVGMEDRPFTLQARAWAVRGTVPMR